MKIKKSHIIAIVIITILTGIGLFFILQQREEKLQEEKLSRIPNKEAVIEMIVKKTIIEAKAENPEIFPELDEDGDISDRDNEEEEEDYKCKRDSKALNKWGEPICKDDYDFKMELNPDGSVNEEEVKKFLIAGLKEWSDGDDYEKQFLDYSGVTDAKFIYIREPDPANKFHRTGFYRGVVCDFNGEVVAGVSLDIMAHGENVDYLAIGGTSPRAAAFIAVPPDEADGVTLEDIQKERAYPYKNIMPVEEEQATDNLFDYFQQRTIVPSEIKIVEGYSSIYLPSGDSVGVDQPFFEYIITDEKGNTFLVWISAETGEVFDADRLEWVDERNRLWEKKFGDKILNQQPYDEEEAITFDEVEYQAKPKK